MLRKEITEKDHFSNGGGAHFTLLDERNGMQLWERYQSETSYLDIIRPITVNGKKYYPNTSEFPEFGRTRLYTDEALDFYIHILYNGWVSPEYYFDYRDAWLNTYNSKK